METHDQSDEKGMFLSSTHPTSRRNAIVEQLDGMIWLYLTEPDTLEPDCDCPVYSLVPPPDKVDWDLIAKTGQPPPITKDIASPAAVLAHPVAGEFSVLWSKDGQSVAVVHGGQMAGMIVAGEKHGHSRALSKESPLGLPFDEALALKTFPEFRKQ